jgi:hypothetical protein
VVLLLKRRNKRTEWKASRAIVISLVLVPLFLAPMDIFFLQGSIYDRALLFFALAAPLYFVPVLISERRRVYGVLLLLAVVMVAVCASTSLYQESLYVVSDRSLQTSTFLSNSMPEGSTVIGGHYPYPIWQKSDLTVFARGEYYSVYNVTFGNLTRDGGPTAMVFDRTTLLWHQQWGTIDLYDFYSNRTGDYSKVLDNGAYRVIYGGA